MMSSLVCGTEDLQTKVTTGNAVGSEKAWSKSAVETIRSSLVAVSNGTKARAAMSKNKI